MPCRATDGDEQVAPGGLIRHLWQIFHVDMHEAWLAGLERLVRLGAHPGPQGIEIAHPMAAQAAIETRARDGRVEKLTANRQQVVQRQQQRPAQLHRHELLRAGQRRRQLMRGVLAMAESGV